MQKRILTLFLSATFVLGAVGLSACSNNELEAKIAELETKTEQLEQEKQELEEQNRELERDYNILQNRLFQIEDFLVKNNIFEMEVADMVELHNWGLSDQELNNVMVVKNLEADSFECTPVYGYIVEFASEDSTSKTYCWKPQNPSTSFWPGLDFDKDFVEIVIKKQNNIIGYALVEISLAEDLSATATVLKSALFLKEAGQYRTITQEQINDIFENLKNK